MIRDTLLFIALAIVVLDTIYLFKKRNYLMYWLFLALALVIGYNSIIVGR